MLGRKWIAVGCLWAAVGVTLGAFGAHALKDTLEASAQLENWRTAVRYQVWHALALILVGLHQERTPRAFFAPWAFLVGSALFSGSIYCLSLDVLRSVMGPITPLGGLLLVIGWVSFALAVLGQPTIPKPEA